MTIRITSIETDDEIGIVADPRATSTAPSTSRPATTPERADSQQLTNLADEPRISRSGISAATFGSSALRSTIVDDGSGPRLHLEAHTIDGLDVDQATALVEALNGQLQLLRQATIQMQ